MRLTVRILVNQMLISESTLSAEEYWKWTQLYGVQLITFTLQFRERSEMIH